MKNIAIIPVLLMSTAPLFAAESSRPNVLIILADDQGYGDFSCHGNQYLSTPNLDKFHDSSIRLDDFHVSPTSTPTRGSLLTGQDPMHNGAWSWAYGNEYINPDVVTMPELFRTAGYSTAHFGKWHLGDNYPFRPQDVGFDETVTFGAAATHQSADYWQNDNLDDYYLMKDGSVKQFEGYATEVWFDLAKDYMKSCSDSDNPFFVYLPLNAAHTPLYVEEQYRAPYEQYGEIVAPYYGMLATIDEQMGELRRFMRREKLNRNTIVIYLTDNGGAYGVELHNAGMQGHKNQYLEGGHRVPCFIKLPKAERPRGFDFDQMTQVQDLYPTIAGLCGIEMPEEVSGKLDGVDLVPYLEDDAKKMDDRKLVIQWSLEERPAKGKCAILWNDWRLIERTQLYNIKRDPSQHNNVFRKNPEIVKEMQDFYNDWWKAVQPVIKKKNMPIVGGEVNPVKLSCNDWCERINRLNVTDQPTIWEGLKVNGVWRLRFAESGEYRFVLRRYHSVVDVPMVDAYPATKRELASFPECRAMPIKSAKIEIEGRSYEVGVAPDDVEVEIDVEVSRGDHSLKSWFLGSDGEELSGAYYLEIEKM